MSLKTVSPLRVIALTLGAASLAHAGSYAGNPYSPTAGHEYRHGVVPTVDTWKKMRDWAAANSAIAQTTGPLTLSFGGGIDGIGVTSSTPKVYLVVYGNQWGTAGTDSNGNMTLSGDPNGEVPRLQQLFKGIGTGGELWSGTMTQYCDGPLVATGATVCPMAAPHVGYPSHGAFAGIWYDNSVRSPTSATPTQLADEAIAAAAHFGNTSAHSNRYAQYVVLSPTGTYPDGFNTSSGNFCAWHDYMSSSYGDIAFTNLPYITDAGANCGENIVNSGQAGILDGVTIAEGHEYAETLTDQNPLGGWSHNTTTGAAEDGDECAWRANGGVLVNVKMGNGSFPMQSTWSNDTNSCAISHRRFINPAQTLAPILSLLLQ